MSGGRFGLRESAHLARRALEGGRPVVLGVVVTAPDPALLGRHMAWDDERIHGELGERSLAESAAALLRDPGVATGCFPIGAGVELYVERVESPVELVVVGAGHIARPLTTVGKLLGFRVTVIDDRAAYARQERFPDADRVLVVDFERPFADIMIGPRTHVVLVTRGHRYDYECLCALAAMGAEPAYVGMIGSRRRVRAAFEQLAQEGFDAEHLAQVHAPIGLDVGAETPAEIAVAIGAEIVLTARGGSGRPLRERARVVRYLRSRTS